MDSIVHSVLGPRRAGPRAPGAWLERALDCAAGQEWRSAHDALQIALANGEKDRVAHYMLWEVCQVLGRPDVAMANLEAALRDNPVTSRHCKAPDRRILALAVPGDFQANLPLGALFDPADTELHTLWLKDPEAIIRDPAAAFQGQSPRFECAFVAIAEDAGHGQALLAADRLAATLGVPVINCGSRIAELSRGNAARLLQGLPDTVVPCQALVSRAALVGATEGTSPDDAPGFPLIIRPSSSHAGKALARLDHPAALRAYLDDVAGDLFYVAPFVDYRSADGLWRKFRVIFVDGRPWPYHLAIHDDWAVWYYNAQMDRDHWKRAEEARFLEDIGQVFPPKALDALRALGERIGLDYFGLDCGLLPDGRVVVFEVETGMIVHDLDPPDLYPYKPAAVRRIRQATERMIDARVARGCRAAA